MTPPPTRSVRIWLWTVAALVAGMVVVGGFVRLSRAGLSIVEWDAVTGVVPPMGEAAWQEAFAQYQQSPEGRTVNADMTLDGYRRIFLIEWFHRLVARLAGLAVLLPLLVFLFRRTIPWRRSGPYWAVVIGFGLQGLLGWLMVASGLVDRPSVSHYRLTAHLMAALALLAFTIWLAMQQAAVAGDATSAGGDGVASLGRDGARDERSARRLRRLGWLLVAVVTIQIVWGGLMAGLKAGTVSDTWPRMLGQLLPDGLLSAAPTWWQSVTEVPLGVHWVHRWLAWAVLAVAAALALAARRAGAGRIARPAAALVVLVGVQIALGVTVIVQHVPLSLALLHQATGVAVFALTVVTFHRLATAGR
jgi:cytochrome c oxidase assembly protein subunit 15